MALSDEELMRRAGGGDLGAFGELYDRYQPPLFAFLCRFTGDAETAEDVTQDVFWRIWQQRERFDARQRFASWAYAIARNMALNELKKPYRRAAPFVQAAEGSWNGHHAGAGEGGAEPAPPGKEIERLEVQARVREALQALSEDQRLCIVMREYEGRSHREIAEALGCSEGNARVITHRARQALRELLRPLLESEESRV